MAENLPDTNVGNIEYIRRQDVIDLWDKYRPTIAVDAIEYDMRLKRLPSADVVQVVKCKDCRKCSYDSLFNYYWCNLTLGTRRVKPDDFCSYGEREG